MNPQAHYDPSSVDVSGRDYSASGLVTERMEAMARGDGVCPEISVTTHHHEIHKSWRLDYLVGGLCCVVCLVRSNLLRLMSQYHLYNPNNQSLNPRLPDPSPFPPPLYYNPFRSRYIILVSSSQIPPKLPSTLFIFTLVEIGYMG